MPSTATQPQELFRFDAQAGEVGWDNVQISTLNKIRKIYKFAFHVDQDHKNNYFIG